MLTTMRDGAERPYLVATCEGTCTTLDRDAILTEVRCRTLQDLETRAARDHQRCDVDGDCALIASMCYAGAVSRAYEAPYRAAHDAHAGECLPAGGGACPMAMHTVACVDHRCAVH